MPIKETSFTKIDSLTETYLGLQDSALQAWNVMINDDNQKIKSMHSLLHELMVADKADHEVLVSLEQRLVQLETLRYNQRTMANADMVEEYDFATSSLISEIITLAEAQPTFEQNIVLKKLTEDITIADQRVNTYRHEYDYIILRYNEFLLKNKLHLQAIDSSLIPKPKPLFQMSDDE